jgi:hypothetical protein
MSEPYFTESELVRAEGVLNIVTPFQRNYEGRTDWLRSTVQAVVSAARTMATEAAANDDTDDSGFYDAVGDVCDATRNLDTLGSSTEGEVSTA